MPRDPVFSVLEKANPIHVLQMAMSNLATMDGFPHSSVSKIMTIAVLYQVMCRLKGIAPDDLYHLAGNYIAGFWESEDDQIPVMQALKAYMENEWAPTNPNTKLREYD